MPQYLFANNAVSTLSATMTLIASTLTVQTGHGARFPNPGANQAFVITVQNGTDYEIMTCTSRSGDVLTVSRGVDGTVAQTWASGSSVDIRIPKLVLDAFAQLAVTLLTTGGTMTGQLLLDDSASTALPVLAFDGDTNTGVAHPASDTMVLSTGGVERVRVTNTALTATVPILADPGLVTAPGITFAGDADTGFYRAGANSIGIATAGVLRVTINETAMSLVMNLAVAGQFTLAGNQAVTGSIAASASITAGVYLRSDDYITAANEIVAGGYIEAGIPGLIGNQAVVFSQFASTLGATGTAIHPGGRIEKWGTGSTTLGVGSVTFAAAFPTACDNVQITVNGGSGAATLYPPFVGAVTAVGFAVYGDVTQSLTFFWRAVGR